MGFRGIGVQYSGCTVISNTNRSQDGALRGVYLRPEKELRALGHDNKQLSPYRQSNNTVHLLDKKWVCQA